MKKAKSIQKISKKMIQIARYASSIVCKTEEILQIMKDEK